MLQIWVYRFNSEFGMRNSELRGDESPNRYLASAPLNILSHQSFSWEEKYWGFRRVP